MLFLGKEMTAEEVFREVEKDESYYRHSGGGVTVSGGEPLQQAGFVRTLLQRCRNEGFHTCIETCGCARPEQLLEVLPYVSLVLFDVKHMDDSAHRRLTGGSNKAIFQNLKLVVEKGVPLIARLPLIPGYNDSAEEITAIARYLAEAKKAVEVEVMPYHNYGAHKYEMLFRPYELTGLARPSKSKLAEAEEIFESLGIRCETRM
jgi:pyruvate formate lyase activating enzyme